jgi:cobalt-zinc-cadmium efflux system protein
MSEHHHHHHDHHHGHAHHHHAPPGGRAFAIGASLNIGLVAGQVVFGLIASSVALLADAAHNFGDVAGLLLAWVAVGLGRRLPSASRTYGWGRSTILAALANAVILLIGTGLIMAEALGRFSHPAPVAGVTVMVVAGAGIVINGATAWLFARSGDDINLRGVFLHMIADALVSLGVVLSAGLILLTGWSWIDPATSLVICAIIAASTWGLLRDALNLAMDGVPRTIAPAQVQAWLAGLPGVSEVHDLHIWALSTTETALTAHLVCTDEADDQGLIQAATQGLGARFAINHATIQVELPALAATCRLRPAHVV